MGDQKLVLPGQESGADVPLEGCPLARLMSSVKDNVGRGLNIALVNGKFPLMWGQSLVEESGTLLCCDLPTPSPQGGGI